MALEINLNALPWRTQLGLVAALAAVSVGVFWCFYAHPYQAELNGRRAALRKTRVEIEKGLEVARRLPVSRTGVDVLERRLDGLRTRLPEEHDVADLLRRVQAMATDSRLTIRRFTPQAVTRKELHAEWPIGLALEGTYHDLGAFLERVSTFPRIINVGNIKIESRENDASGATVVAYCTATAFVLITQAHGKDKKDKKDEAPAEGRKTPAPSAALPVHAGAASVQAAAATPNVDVFAYRSEGRRDPFVSLLRRDTPSAHAPRIRPAGLKGLGAGEVTLRGIVASQGGYVAILQGSDSKTYIVRPGEHLADGTIRSITADAMVILQHIDDPSSLEKQREVRKALRPIEEARP